MPSSTFDCLLITHLFPQLQQAYSQLRQSSQLLHHAHQLPESDEKLLPCTRVQQSVLRIAATFSADLLAVHYA